MHKRYRYSVSDRNMSAHDDPFGQEDKADEPISEQQDNLNYFEIVEGNFDICLEGQYYSNLAIDKMMT